MASKLKESIKSENKTSCNRQMRYTHRNKKKTVGITKSEFEIVMENEWRNMRKQRRNETQNNNNNSTEKTAETINKSCFYTVPFDHVNYRSPKFRNCSHVSTDQSTLYQNKVYTKNKPALSMKVKKVEVQTAPPNRAHEDLNKYNVKSKVKSVSFLIDPLPEATTSDRWAHRIRLAVSEGGSKNVHKNERLRDVIIKALEDEESWNNIERTLNDCGVLHKVTKNCFLLQIRVLDKVDVVCLVRTSNILKFKRRILPIFKEYEAVFSSVLHNFNHCCVIDALASYRTPINFTEFERTLSKDAVDCHATEIEIVDYETGAVHLKCHPLELPEVCEALEQREYKILYSDYGISPSKYIELEPGELQLCTDFFKALKKYRCVERIYSNLSSKRP